LIKSFFAENFLADKTMGAQCEWVRKMPNFGQFLALNESKLH